jgi:hypothetical protein
MPTAPDPDLRLRGQLLRSLGRLREMLPGSFVERKRSCGRANCRCADGKNLHIQYQISVLVDGRPKTFNVPAALVQQVREHIELRKRFEAAAATICNINLRRFLKPKEKP